MSKYLLKILLDIYLGVGLLIICSSVLNVQGNYQTDFHIAPQTFEFQEINRQIQGCTWSTHRHKLELEYCS
jgi:hypothetical protein